MTHQGELLQEAIKHSGISITRIVEELGITRPTIYRKFKDVTLDSNFVNAVGKIIGHDFSDSFTFDKHVTSNNISHVTKSIVISPVTPLVTTRNATPIVADSDLPKQLLALQTKYIALLEAYNELLLKVYNPQ